MSILFYFAGALLALLIPVWYAPFLIAALRAIVVQKIPTYFLLLNFLIYSISCMLFCFYIRAAGSEDLVRRIGELFMGVSPFVLSLVSSLLFGMNAVLGAWCGITVRSWFYKKV